MNSTLKYVFQNINIIDDVTARLVVEKTVALSRPQFQSDFLVILYVSIVFLITRFGIIVQFFTLSISGRNSGSKNTKWSPKYHF